MPRWAALTIGSLALAGVAVAVLTTVGSQRWSALTSQQEQALLALPETSTGRSRVAFRDYEQLPAPVARYITLALRNGQDMIRIARFREHGRLRTDPLSDRWMRFQARQVVAPLSIGFIWDARIRLAPALHIRVRDTYINGEGSGQASRSLRARRSTVAALKVRPQ